MSCIFIFRLFFGRKKQYSPLRRKKINYFRSTSTTREGLQNTHYWSGRTETATENGVGQAGSCYHCGSNSSVASSPISMHHGQLWI